MIGFEEIVPGTRTWAEIDESALAGNLALLKRLSAPARLLAVVKADAYGHGVSLVAPLCAAQGIADFGVATAAEGIALRLLLPAEAAIYLLGPALPDEAPAIVEHRLKPLLSDLAMGRALSDAARSQNTIAEAHLDIDTGIGRAGAALGDARDLLAVLDRQPNLRMTGVATHFASADEDPADALLQRRLFEEFLLALGSRADTLLRHEANSPGLLLPVCSRSGLVRPGLLLYGIEPTPGDFARLGLPFQPVLSLKTRVTLCRALPFGATISYGRTFVVPSGGGVYATLGVGYGDGYPRRLSGSGFVLLHGQRAPICGRVCMDQTVVDVSSIPGVQSGDTATLIGTEGSQTLSAGDLAAALQTTPHEITTGLTARVSRILVKTAL